MKLQFFLGMPAVGTRVCISAIIDGVNYVEESTVISRQSIGGRQVFFTNGQMIVNGVTLKQNKRGWSAYSATAKKDVDVTVEFV